MARVTDIRLLTNFFTDIRTVRLRKACGDIGVIDLQKLWIYTAEHYPKGILIGLCQDDVESLIGTETNGFLGILQQIGFVKRSREWFELVDWEHDQSWVYNAPERSAKASKASKARWNNDELEL